MQITHSSNKHQHNRVRTYRENSNSYINPADIES